MIVRMIDKKMPGRTVIWRRAFSWSRYWASQGLFYLDGTISGTSLLDISGNDRHFTITGKDFATDWTNGIPYKSAATISAPVGDATLIAADVNNFLYDVGGTPNEIPVISLFQDIDYEHKIFCKHAAQVVDGNGVETYEPRVLEIFMAPSALSGAGLVKAQTYFGVPDLQIGDKFFSVNGNDGTGDGSQANPYLTIGAAMAAATSRVIAMTGVFDLSATAVTLTKDVLCVGRTKFTNFGATYGFILATKKITGAWFDSARVYACYSSNSGTLDKCLDTTSTRNMVYNNNGTALVVTNCVATFTGTTYRTIASKCDSVTVTGCYFKETNTGSIELSKAAATAVIKYNKFRGTVSSCIYQNIDITSADISYNDANTTGSLYYCNTTRAGAFTFNYNVGTVANGFYANGGTGSVTALNNELTITANGITSLEKDATIKYNIINASGAASSPVVVSSEVNDITISIENNTLINATDANMLIVGNEGHAVQDKVSGVVKNNYCKGPIGSTAMHGIFVFNNPNVDVKYNFVEDCGLAIVLKGDGVDYSPSAAMYNICKNGRITVKGVINANVIGNTILMSDDTLSDMLGIHLLANNTDDSTGTVIKNNIIIIEVTGVDNNCIYAGDTDQTFTADYNLYYNVNAALFKRGATAYTFTEWQTFGQDASGDELTAGEFAALFNNYASDDYSLPLGSAAVGTGETLAAAYDDGLNASTDWGDNENLPIVVTKQQTVPWDIGAYVS